MKELFKFTPKSVKNRKKEKLFNDDLKVTEMKFSINLICVFQLIILN